MSSTALPYLGLGLSSNLDAAAPPRPYRILESSPGLFDFVEYSAPLDLEEARAHASLFGTLFDRREETPVLFHPVHLNLFGPELEDPAQLALLDAHAKAVGSAWVGNDVGWWHRGGEPFPGYLYLPPPLSQAGLEEAVLHALHVQAHLSVPLVLENPALIAAQGPWHVLDFMGRLHARTGRPLLLDLGHLFSHQLARGLPLTAGFDGFPFEAVVEVHLAGGVVTRSGGRAVYVDDHTQPVREELFALLEEVLPRCTRLRALVFEGDGHPDEIALKTLSRLRPLVPSPSSAEAPEVEVPPAPGPASGSPGEGRALFEERYGIAPAGEDPEGIDAELDFRLAALAQALDRRYPLTRLLLAGTREALLAFTRAPQFGAVFTHGEGTVERAFFAFAAAEVRERGDRALEAVLALERAGAASAPGVDLSEATWAARALRRHLAGRAWVSGTLELSGLESLWQVVRRALGEATR